MKKQLLLITLCFIFKISRSQTADLPPYFDLIKSAKNNFITFYPVYKENKVYIKWVYKTDKRRGFFIIEKSDDGINFKSIAVRHKEAVEQTDINLFYSYVDDKILNEKIYYRVVDVSSDNTYSMTSVCEISN